MKHVAIRANGRIVASGGSTGSVTVRGLPATVDRQWFDLVPDKGDKLHLADRLVKLDGTDNFRDAGGYRTADGHWVKMGVVYRSNALNNLTDAGLGKLKRLGISVDYDLRMTSERTSAPDRLPSGVRYVVATSRVTTVFKDYLASNTYRAAANAAALASMPADQAAVYKPLLDVRPEYLDSGFDEVKDRYGSFFSYEKALGLDAKEIKKLKSELLSS